MSLDRKGCYQVVAKDEDDLNRYTIQNLVTPKLENFLARLKRFVVTEREDPMLATDADNHIHNGRKEEPSNLTFEVKFLGNPTTETLATVCGATSDVTRHCMTISSK